MIESTVPNKPLLDVSDLNVKSGAFSLVKNLSFSVNKEECVCLVGESGCGKSLTGLSLMGLVPQNLHMYAKHILFENQDIAQFSQKQLSAIRGNKLAMVFQDPLSSLNPVLTLGLQVAEPLMRHHKLSKKEAMNEAGKLLEEVGIEKAFERLKDYPHQFSGGMLQRVMIAMMLACRPSLLIADEPTTALDSQTQEQIVALLKERMLQNKMALIFITHDLSLAQTIAHKIGVMYCGELVELRNAPDFFQKPLHPYSQGLLKAIPTPEFKNYTVFPSIPGNVPSPFQPISGCVFRERCSFAFEKCHAAPPWKNNVRCWLTEI